MLVDDRTLRVIEPVTGEVLAEHALVAPGETSIVDDHYGGPRPGPATPRGTPENAEREGVPGAGAGRRGVPDRGRRGRGHQADQRDRRDPHPGRSPRHRPVLAALERAVAFRRWRAADVRSILAANGQAPQPRPAGQALVLTLPQVPTRSLDAYRSSIDGGDAVVTATTPPPLAADLTEGLKRLKMAAMRRLAPELLVTAKTQRWNPEEFLRTLVEAEITARDASNARTRLRQAAFPVTKTLDEFDVAASSIPPATFDYLASLEWVRAAENVCLIGPAGTGKSHILVALGIAAVEAGHRVRYFTAAELVETLYRGLADNSVGRGHRHPAPQRPRPRRRARASHPWTTPAPSCCSGSSPPPTNAAPSASDRTGPSSPGAGSCPNTPPPSACSTGSCTTATPSSPTATPTG